ncbi:hypothetical protein BK816_03805 [Boudabousia tangfeifanii]|uniref:HIT domain-containing protein n=1 Tax=Boudabousia tangfeifanii TaxID=1912795 RepID=A0A1D9MJQ0_9ACTO|nr:HIT family protein [Boudabousia tangfeifanii]AOZ72527.1 hypothetical protein BK816_03805 [Boudabousia tangfeifanii]
MSTIFEKIIAGEIPGNFVWADDDCVAIMDIAPVQPGHVMVIPRKPVDHFYDVEPQLAATAFQTSQKIAKVMASTFDCTRVGLMIMGYGVPHTHLHLVPINSEKDLIPDPSRTNPSPEELAKKATELRAALRVAGYETEVTQAEQLLG